MPKKEIGVFFCCKSKDEGPAHRVGWVGRRRKVRILSSNLLRQKSSLLAPNLKPAACCVGFQFLWGGGLQAAPPLLVKGTVQLTTGQEGRELSSRAFPPRHLTGRNQNPLTGIALRVRIFRPVFPENTKEDKKLKPKW